MRAAAADGGAGAGAGGAAGVLRVRVVMVEAVTALAMGGERAPPNRAVQVAVVGAAAAAAAVPTAAAAVANGEAGVVEHGLKGELRVEEGGRRAVRVVDPPKHRRAEPEQFQLLHVGVCLQHCEDDAVGALPAEAHRRLVVGDDVAQDDEGGAQHLHAAEVREDGREHRRHAALAHERRNVRRVARDGDEEGERAEEQLVILEVGEDAGEDDRRAVLLHEDLHVRRIVRHVGQDRQQREQQLVVRAVDVLAKALQHGADAILQADDDRRELRVEAVEVAQREHRPLEQRLAVRR